MNKSRYMMLWLSLTLIFGGTNLRAKSPSLPDIFRAANVATQDFSAKLKADSSDKWKYSAYVADIRNYNIGLSDGDGFYVVVFLLKRGAVNLKGGGAE